MEEKTIIEEKSAPSRTRAYLIGMLIGFGVSLVTLCIGFTVSVSDSLENIMYFLLFGGALFGVYYIVLYLMSKCQITVTTHRVFGKAIKQEVDLPLDSISAIKKGWFKSVAVTTASGSIKFYLLSKQAEIYRAISALLIERQSRQANPQTTILRENKPQGNAEELKQYKELLDGGVISQEEFDAKKKQLLGL